MGNGRSNFPLVSTNVQLPHSRQEYAKTLPTAAEARASAQAEAEQERKDAEEQLRTEMLKRFEEKKSKYTCFGCDQPFTGGYYYALLGKLWHQHCFSCTKCGTALTEETGWCVMERKGCGGVGGEGRERGGYVKCLYMYVCGGCYPRLVQSTNSTFPRLVHLCCLCYCLFLFLPSLPSLPPLSLFPSLIPPLSSHLPRYLRAKEPVCQEHAARSKLEGWAMKTHLWLAR